MVPHKSQALYSILDFACLFSFVCCYCCLICSFFCLSHPYVCPSIHPFPTKTFFPTTRQSMQYVSMKLMRQLGVYLLGVTFCRLETSHVEYLPELIWFCWCIHSNHSFGTFYSIPLSGLRVCFPFPLTWKCHRFLLTCRTVRHFCCRGGFSHSNCTVCVYAEWLQICLWEWLCRCSHPSVCMWLAKEQVYTLNSPSCCWCCINSCYTGNLTTAVMHCS